MAQPVPGRITVAAPAAMPRAPPRLPNAHPPVPCTMAPNMLSPAPTALTTEPAASAGAPAVRHRHTAHPSAPRDSTTISAQPRAIRLRRASAARPAGQGAAHQGESPRLGFIRHTPPPHGIAAHRRGRPPAGHRAAGSGRAGHRRRPSVPGGKLPLSTTYPGAGRSAASVCRQRSSSCADSTGPCSEAVLQARLQLIDGETLPRIADDGHGRCTSPSSSSERRSRSPNGPRPGRRRPPCHRGSSPPARR